MELFRNVTRLNNITFVIDVIYERAPSRFNLKKLTSSNPFSYFIYDPNFIPFLIQNKLIGTKNKKNEDKFYARFHKRHESKFFIIEYL